MTAPSNSKPFTVLASAIASVPNRELWLDSTDAAHITVATGVSAWADKTGNGRALTQAVGARQPVVTAALLNGLPGVRFDGVDDRLTMAWPAAAQLSGGSTLYVVADVKFANDVLYRPLVRLTPSGAACIQHNSSTDGGSIPSRSKLVTFIATNAGTKLAIPAALTAPGPRLITSRVAPAEPSITLYKNGVLDGGPTIGFASLTSTVGDTFGLCVDDAANIGWYDVFELLVFSRAVTPVEDGIVAGFLRTRWGLP